MSKNGQRSSYPTDKGAYKNKKTPMRLEDISGPIQFQHVNHISVTDEKLNFQVKNSQEFDKTMKEMLDVLKSMGKYQPHVHTKKTRAMSAVENSSYGNFDLTSTSSNKKRMAPPPPSMPSTPPPRQVPSPSAPEETPPGTPTLPKKLSSSLLQDTAAANVELVDDGKCEICMESYIDCAFFDCGHSYTCYSCSRDLAYCPYCRKEIIQILKIYTKK